MNKRILKNSTSMSNTLIEKLGCSDVYRAYVLISTTNKSGKTDTTIEQLAEFCDEKPSNYQGGKTTKSFIESLRDTKVVNIETTRAKALATGSFVKRTYYSFHETRLFRVINIEFYTLNLDIKLKGYLLKLFSMANTVSLCLEKSANEIAKTVGVTKATQKKYNAELETKGLLVKTLKGYRLNVPGFNQVAKKVMTVKTKKIVTAHIEMVKMYAAKYNKQHPTNPVLSSTTENLERLRKAGLNSQSFIIARYYVSNWANVTDINALVENIVTGAYKVPLPKATKIPENINLILF